MNGKYINLYKTFSEREKIVQPIQQNEIYFN